MWVCSDSITGDIYSFDVYTGANPSVPKHPKDQAYSVVMKLMESVLGTGHVVYTDHFYSSPVLFEDLLAKGTLASGTVRTNRRNFPQDLKAVAKLSRGDSKLLYHGNITACRWFDNRDVYSLSSVYSDSLTLNFVRRQVDKQMMDVSCPEIIADYNKYMGGVDLADQAMCYYSVGRKTMKWWRRVFLEDA